MPGLSKITVPNQGQSFTLRPSALMIIALVSRKGGVGKTTSAVNLAAALARFGKRVLLIDLDSQASSTLSVGVARGDLSRTAADVLLGDTPIQSAVYPTQTPGLDLVPASADLLHADFELGTYRHKERRLAERLASIKSEYHAVVIDCPPSLSVLPANAIVASDGFVVPVAPQYLASEGVANFIASAERLASRVQSPTRLIGLLLTMVDYRVKATREIVDSLRARFGSAVFAVEIRINVRLAEAPGAGQPIFEYDPTATGAKAYLLAAEELMLRSGMTAPPPAASPPFVDGDPVHDAL